MKNSLIFVAYYIYAIFVVTGSCYLVFWKGISEWYFLVSLLLLEKSPITRNKQIEE